MLERKISDDLLEWKRSGTGKALLLTGARQIGKSYAVREFAKHEYAHYLEINLYENKQAAERSHRRTTCRSSSAALPCSHLQRSFPVIR